MMIHIAALMEGTLRCPTFHAQQCVFFRLGLRIYDAPALCIFQSQEQSSLLYTTQQSAFHPLPLPSASACSTWSNLQVTEHWFGE